MEIAKVTPQNAPSGVRRARVHPRTHPASTPFADSHSDALVHRLPLLESERRGAPLKSPNGSCMAMRFFNHNVLVLSFLLELRGGRETYMSFKKKNQVKFMHFKKFRHIPLAFAVSKPPNIPSKNRDIFKDIHEDWKEKGLLYTLGAIKRGFLHHNLVHIRV